MRFLVFDVPASEMGALAILTEFHSFVWNHSEQSDQWTFVVATDQLRVEENDKRVRILRYPEVKRSWGARILFEIFEAPRIAVRERPDAILSLQNTAVLRTRVAQVVYVHQSIPYGGWRFLRIRSRDHFLTFRAILLRLLIGWSVRKAHTTIVQTTWLKLAIVKKHRVPQSKVLVVAPSVKLPSTVGSVHVSSLEFFYPTSSFAYKNIDVIVDAVSILNDWGYHPLVLVTISGHENPYARRVRTRIQAQACGDSVKLVGRMPFAQMAELYRRATLIFPSVLESFGIPLLEAREFSTPVIASDMPFSKEILSDYPKVAYFDPANPRVLAELMRIQISGRLWRKSDRPLEWTNPVRVSRPGWERVVSALRQAATRAS